MTSLDLQRKSLPNEPGVYLFKGKKDEILYVGKAKDLKKRVSQYFLKISYSDPYYEEKVKELVSNIKSIEYIVTENEKEALILENIQIKNHNPRFNVHMRDSKSYPYVAIFYAEEYPRIGIIRGPEKYSKENLFLGPYTDKKEIRRILRDLRKIFSYCSCRKKVRRRERPCLYYQLKLCPGPCIGPISQKEYLENITKIEMFLKGETEELKNQINSKMRKASVEQNYEMAAFWRDKLEAIDNSTTQQHVLLDNEANKDIFGYYSGKNYAAVIVIHIREGRITRKSPIALNLKNKIIQKQEVLSSLLEQYYQNTNLPIPDIIIIPKFYSGMDLLREFLKDIKSDIQIRTPLDENEEALLRIANKNAKVMVDQQFQMEDIKQKEEEKLIETLETAQEILGLPSVPRIIEGFDISNIEGIDATGSVVYFLEGKPFNKYYRHFKIRSKATPDDVAMMKEVIKRRYSYLLDRNLELPDLILVDGGKGQLNAAVSVLKDLGIDGIPAIGLAKKYEEIFKPGEKDPIILPDNSPLLKLFQRVRDESHRFAIKLHKKQRKKRISSILDDIRGIGPATRNKLLKQFGSVEGIKKSSIDKVSKVVGNKLAKTILETLKENS